MKVAVRRAAQSIIPFSQKHNLNYFALISVDDREQCLIHCTDPVFMEDRFKAGMRIKSFARKSLQNPLELVFWSEVESTEDRKINRNFGYFEGLGIMLKKKNCYHMVSFGVGEHFPMPCSYFLNHKQSFINAAREYMRENLKDLKLQFSNACKLPSQLNDPYYEAHIKKANFRFAHNRVECR